ncbi:hypothetical protein D8M04_03465 [Oceanobacillus piezotolerans]|uniref:ABM domain-containing protein n=1 Tax=Oceanobacillus piezotolerans TaxID=2448030 RepID=A0A498DE28_9BACI|nr:hypothetical protein [Oceanobacillus piezotolerans]RLL48336.1 hypothetical protein D8M04_03465 [Oceanobacillus piezotolerans]
MYVKVYQYHIQKDRVEEYLDIQKKTSEIYDRYLDIDLLYLNNQDDDTKWIEVTRYKDKDEYEEKIIMINGQKEIQELFESFQSLLVPDKNEITEENYIEIKPY